MSSLTTSLTRLALQMKGSADLPRQADATIDQLAAEGLLVRRLVVWLDVDRAQSQRTILLPRPVTRTVTPATAALRQRVIAGGCALADAVDGGVGVDATIVCGTDAVEITCDQLPAEDGLDLATGLIVLARRAEDLSAIERTTAQLGQLDDQLLALHAGSLDLAGADADGVARRMVEVAMTHLGYDRAGVFLTDQSAGVVKGVMGVDATGQIVPIEQTCFDLHASVEKGDSEIAAIARGDLDHFLSQDLDGEGRASLEGDIHHNALVPMCYADRILGVFAVDNYFTNRPIAEADFPRLMILANQGAVSLIHASLQNDLRRARDDLEATVTRRTDELANTNRQLVHTLEERRLARAAEQRAQERLLHLLASGPAVIYSCRVESGFPLAFVSDNVLGLTGYRAGELVADPGLWSSLLHPQDTDQSFDDVAGLLRQGRRSLEYRIRHRDGHWCWIQDDMLVVRPERDGQGTPPEIVGSWLDITRRRQAEVERQQAVEELESQQALAMRSDRLRSLGEMAAGIAHELNQPLAGVRGMAEHMVLAVQRNWDLSGPTIEDRSQKIVDQADRMIQIINHVRVFAREAGKPEMVSVQVNEVVGAAVDLLAVQLRTSGIELVIELADALPPVRANAFSLEEVLLNLLANARDAVLDKTLGAGQYSGGRIQLRTRVARAGRVCIEVADNGEGVDAVHLERVFEPFFTTKGPDRGTGLGLSISRSIIEQFGGRLYFEPAPEEGALAVVALPPDADTPAA